MGNEFLNKPSKIIPAQIGQLANPDDYNNNIAAQNKDSLIGIDANGNYTDFNVGDESKASLITNLKMRLGGFIKIYDSFGNFLNNISFAQATTTVAGTSILPELITIKNNVTDPANDIDFTAGVAQWSDGSGQVVFGGKTKRLDAAWVFGDGNGGLDVGSIAANAYYYCYIIYNPTSNLIDALFSLSPTAPTLPSGYTKTFRVGSIKTTTGPAIDQAYLGITTNFGQIVKFQTGAMTTGAATIPYDNTPPQNTEGNQYMSSVIAPLKSYRKLKIDICFQASNATADGFIAALFQDNIINAIAAGDTHTESNVGNKQGIINFTHYMLAGNTNAITFNLRAGSQSPGTLTFNGNNGNQIFNGVMASSITITEY